MSSDANRFEVNLEIDRAGAAAGAMSLCSANTRPPSSLARTRSRPGDRRPGRMSEKVMGRSVSPALRRRRAWYFYNDAKMVRTLGQVREQEKNARCFICSKLLYFILLVLWNAV